MTDTVTQGPSYDSRRIMEAVLSTVRANAEQIVTPETFSVWAHLRKLLLNIMRATDCEFGFIAQNLIDDSGQKLQVLVYEDTRWTDEQRKTMHNDDWSVKDVYLTDAETFYGWVVRNETAVVTNDPANDHRCAHREIEGSTGVRNFCGLPIMVKGRLFGLLALGNRAGGFVGDEENSLRPFVDLVISTHTMGTRFLATQAMLNEQISMNSIAKERNVWLRNGTMWPKLAHDLNGIFAIVAMQTELMRTRLDDPEAVARGLDRIDSAVSKLSLYTTQLDLLGRVVGTESSPAPVVDSCRGLVFATQLASPSGIAISVMSSLSDEAWVNMSTSQFQLVVGSLLSNAVEAVGENGSVLVDISSPRQGHVMIDVTDSGPGIDPSLREGLFSRPQSTKPGPDRGYGLMAVKALVTRTIGEISLQDHPVGTRIRVLLPTVNNPRS